MTKLTIKTGLRAGALALAMAGLSLTGAMPAQAESGISFQFTINGGGGDGGGYGLGGFRPRPFEARPTPVVCWDNADIVRELRHKGYRNVKFVHDADSDVVWIVAQRRGQWYELQCDRCSQRMSHVKKVRRHADGGFSLSFNF